MNLVDSCGWLEYFADGPNADFFAGAIEETKKLIVPSICLHEVYKKVCAQKGEVAAIQVVSQMQEGKVVSLDADIALLAAQLSMNTKLPMADSLILASARANNALVWTQDVDFKWLPDVKYIDRQ